MAAHLKGMAATATATGRFPHPERESKTVCESVVCVCVRAPKKSLKIYEMCCLLMGAHLICNLSRRMCVRVSVRVCEWQEQQTG